MKCPECNVTKYKVDRDVFECLNCGYTEDYDKVLRISTNKYYQNLKGDSEENE